MKSFSAEEPARQPNCAKFQTSGNESLSLLTYEDLGTAATNINHYKTLVVYRHRLENSNVDEPRLFHAGNDVDNNPCFIERPFDENGSILSFPNRARRYGHDIGVVNGSDLDQTSKR